MLALECDRTCREMTQDLLVQLWRYWKAKGSFSRGGGGLATKQSRPPSFTYLAAIGMVLCFFCASADFGSVTVNNQTSRTGTVVEKAIDFALQTVGNWTNG